MVHRNIHSILGYHFEEDVPLCRTKMHYQIMVTRWPPKHEQAWDMHINMIHSILSAMGGVNRQMRYRPDEEHR